MAGAAGNRQPMGEGQVAFAMFQVRGQFGHLSMEFQSPVFSSLLDFKPA